MTKAFSFLPQSKKDELDQLTQLLSSIKGVEMVIPHYRRISNLPAIEAGPVIHMSLRTLSR